MPPKGLHESAVAAWLQASDRAAPAEEFVDHFEASFNAVWRRALETLSEITLQAIGDRVLFLAARRFPPTAGITFGPTGIQCAAVRKRGPHVPNSELEAGLCFVLAEFLHVLGSLTAEILTPALHRTLAETAPTAPPSAESGDRGPS
jgi:hypothetical protein